MKKSGLADSPFFRMSPPASTAVAPLATPDEPTSLTPTPLPRLKKPRMSAQPKLEATKPPRNRDTTHGTMTPRHHDTMVEIIRKAVREFGKEAATHRFTSEEKKAVADIIYAYKRRDIRTSENEVARIAVNFLVSDYQANGENSVLHRVLEALNT